MDDGSQLLKALNVLMLKILDNADRTSSFVVLINLLRPLDPSRWPLPASNETFAVRNEKFSDLVVKCLIKLTKEGNVANQREHLILLLANIHIQKANKQSVLKYSLVTSNLVAAVDNLWYLKDGIHTVVLKKLSENDLSQFLVDPTPFSRILQEKDTK
ncbi:protein MOR1-like [Humulus lupulus]|uniref:protein MOR1-like n=1 Tax=Humulus lupulus TaxID=3486 RepID=UPI002B4169C1|nr:protein MOR1-like [Humulus lupulus]